MSKNADRRAETEAKEYRQRRDDKKVGQEVQLNYETQGPIDPEPICVGDRNHDDYGYAKDLPAEPMSEERKAALLAGVTEEDIKTVKDNDVRKKLWDERKVGDQDLHVAGPQGGIRYERIEPLEFFGYKPPHILKFKLAEPGAKLPTKERREDAGIDFYTNITAPVTIHPGDGYVFPTGIKSEIPPGYCILVWDRSSLGARLVSKCAGVIDSGYRDVWYISIANHGRYPREFLPGDKIAQGILTEVLDVDIRDVDQHPLENGTLAASDRGEKGFGSSGR